MRERTNRTVSKTVVSKGTVGSNPTPSAIDPWGIQIDAPRRSKLRGKPITATLAVGVRMIALLLSKFKPSFEPAGVRVHPVQGVESLDQDRIE